MKVSTQSSFVKYEMDQEELVRGSHFSPESRALIQNMIAESAEEKVALTYDPQNPQKFLQAEAELQGKIGILKYLLSLESLHNPEVN